MAKQSTSRVTRMEIPSKTDLSISDTLIKTNNTRFPGSDYLDRPFKGSVLGSRYGTSDQDWDNATRDLQAPIELPSRNSLRIKLVDSNLVYKFEEYRSDGSFFTAFFWTLVGTILSMLYDFVFIIPPPLSSSQIALIVLVGIFTIVFGLLSLRNSLRANNKLKEIRASEIER